MKPTWNRATTILAWMLVILGMVLRVQRFCVFRSLWLDELFLADNILHRGWHDLLFLPLSQFQAAPPGFLILEKLSVLIFGSGERALRLPSMLAGVASGPMFLLLVRRILNPRAGIIAIALFVFLGPLIYYSNELKPYEVDAAMALGISLAIFWFAESPSNRNWVIVILLGAIGVLCSFPAIFILVGVGLAVMIGLPRHDSERQGVAILAGVVTFGMEQWILWGNLHDPVTHAYLSNYWLDHDGFMPIWPIWWIFRALVGIFRSPGAMWLDFPGAALCAMAVGAAVAMRQRGPLLKIVAPFPLILLASAMRQYPFADRLVLFFVPVFLIVIAAGIAALWVNWTGKTAATFLWGLTLLPAARLSTAYFFVPAGREESLQTYQWVAGHWQAGDQLYLSYHAPMSYQYYGTRAGLKFNASDVSIEPRIGTDMRPVFEDVKRFAGKGRVWVVQVHTDEGPYDQQALTLLAMDQVGNLVLKHMETGAGAWLYDCEAGGSLHAEQLPHVNFQLQPQLQPRGDQFAQIRNIAE